MELLPQGLWICACASVRLNLLHLAYSSVMILDLNLIHDSRIQEESTSLEELGLSQNKLAQVILAHYEHSCGWKKVYTPCKLFHFRMFVN